MSQQITDELRVIVEAEVERAIANFKKLDDSVEGSEKKTKSLSDAIDKIAGKAMLLSTAVAGAGIASIKFAADIESTRTSLSVLLKDGDAATKMFSDWQQLAALTPLSGEDIADAGKKLLAFNIDAGKVTDTLRVIGDISAATGSNISDIADIYGKAAVQGRLFAEDINQFQGRGIPVVQALAKQFGVTEAAVRDLVKEGKVGFPEVEKAFAAMTGPGGQFEGMMERLSETTMGKFSTAMDNAKMAAASFGTLMLPMANDLIDAAGDMASYFQDLDDGTKRFMISFGGVVAISGPTILAVNGINTALKMLSANHMILGITAAVAGVALITSAINAQAHAYEDLNSRIAKTNDKALGVIDAFSKGNKEKTLDAATTIELIRLYPELATAIEAYKTKASDATEAIKKLNEQKTIDAANSQIEQLRKEYIEVGKAAAAYNEYADKLAATRKIDPLEAKEGEYALNIRKASWDDAVKKAAITAAQINASLATIGKQIGANYQIIEIPVTLNPENKNSGNDAKKKWQQWFEEIAGIQKDLFTKDLSDNETSGAKAGRLYVEGLEKALTLDQSIADRIGASFNISDVLASQQDEVRKTLTELLSIDPSQIDEKFEFKNKSIQALIDQFRALNAQINGLNFTKTLTGLNSDIVNLSKSERDLAEETYRANGFTEAQAKILADANAEFSRAEILNAYTVRLDEMGKSTEELARSKLVLLGATEQELRQFDEMVEKLSRGDGVRSFQEYFTDGTSQMLESWGVLDKTINTTLADMSYQLANMSFGATLDGLNQIGQALGEGADAGKAMGAAMAAMAQQILDNLPMMFLQAGLQLIANGQWPMGLAFIAAAGSSAVIGGYIKGKQNAEADTKNAHGNVYGEGGLHAFVRGGTFTNQIVDIPTLFKFASGTGLMGEAGPEAIVPLRRLPNGDLGVQSHGSGAAAPVVNIINNTGASVETRQSQRGGGVELDVIVGNIMDKNISEGRHDDALGGRYQMNRRIRRG